MTRYFTIENSSTRARGGRYHGEDPTAAARKAAQQILKEAKKRHASFILRETTDTLHNYDKRSYRYSATRTKLSSPIHVVRAGQKITIKFRVHVKSEGKLQRTPEQEEAKHLARTRAVSGGSIGGPAPGYLFYPHGKADDVKENVNDDKAIGMMAHHGGNRDGVINSFDDDFGY